MAMHTPGPWKTIAVPKLSGRMHSGTMIVDEKNRVIVDEIYLGSEEENANSRLIAAAPELFDAVEKAIGFTELNIVDSTFIVQSSKVKNILMNAILKAKGETQ